MQISCAVTPFVFAYAKSRFSNDTAYILHAYMYTAIKIWKEGTNVGVLAWTRDSHHLTDKFFDFSVPSQIFACFKIILFEFFLNVHVKQLSMLLS